MKRNLKLLEFLKCHNEKAEGFNENIEVLIHPSTILKSLQFSLPQQFIYNI